MIETVELASTGRTTTRLGFGCAHLAGALGRKESIAILECAYEAGIRHFDVARMYGSGDAEKCLAELACRHPDSVTVATKFGISPYPRRRLCSLARSAFRPVSRLFPHLRLPASAE